MKHSCTIIKLFAVMLFCSVAALAQTSGNLKQFNKDGLAFDYPNNWTLNDSSNSNSQLLILSRDGNDSQIRIFVYRAAIDTPEKLTQARAKLVDPYLDATEKQFTEMGAKPTRTPASIQVGSAQAEGVRISAVLDSIPGEAAIYWLPIGNRLVVLTFFGPNPALKQATPAWETIRNSIRIESNKPAK